MNTQKLQVELDTISNKLIVIQDFTLYNQTPKTLTSIYLNAWANAYSGRETELSHTKLEARKGTLYFSEKKDRGKVDNLYFRNALDEDMSFDYEDREFVKLDLDLPLKRGESISFRAHYEVKIPVDHFTKYGRNDEGDYLLKYFFLEPAVMDENGKWVLQHYKDFEEPFDYPSDIQLEIKYPENYHLYTDLDGSGQNWSGDDIGFFRLYFTKYPEKSHSFKDQKSGLEIDFGYYIDKQNASIIDSLIPSQLAFLEEHLGKLPADKLFISSKTKKEQLFFGVDDLKLVFTEIRPFTAAEKNSLKLFQLLAYEYADRLFLTNKNNDHWLKNGLQYYLMMKFVDQYFPDLKIIGHAADNFKVLGMRPFNFFDAAKLKMNERYKFGFLYVAIPSYDQPINTPFDELSNLNQIVVSGFKTGFTFYYLDKYLGHEEFSHLIKDFSHTNRGKLVNQIDFRNYLIEHSSQDLSWFFDDYIDKKDRINFKLISAKKTNEGLAVKIKNETGFKGAFQLSGLDGKETVQTYWYQNPNKKFEVIFPKGNYNNLALNPDFLFPEVVERDNYMRVSGIFRNMKKIQFKLYPDVENPKFAQIFLSPQLRWNNYDKFQIGVRFQNQSLIRRPFKWQVTPKWSTGMNMLTGSGSVQYTFYPKNSIFRFLRVGTGGVFEHYDRDLSYSKWSLYSVTEFKKEYRSNLNQGLILSFDYLNKEVPFGMVQSDKERYDLYNLTYYYSKPDYIHEFSGSTTFQTTAVFRKIFAEAHYRWRYAPKKQLGVRVFAGTFINNKADTDFFDFGLSRITDYGFNYNLLGRSETSGVLSQQFVMAEAGFKTFFDTDLVNQWMSSMNLEIPIWKMFDLYADLGVYKNKGVSANFVYDTGIRFRLIPDFLELYFPIQSSIGLEPAKSNYAQRIRFTFNMNLGKLVSHLRRGWY